MKASTCLKISSVCFFLLSIFVLITLWLTPEVLPYYKNQEAIEAARGWGDVNGLLFLSLALIWFLSSNLEDLKPKKVIGMSNFIIAIILLSLAIFHHLVLTGPPPPVFILITISGGMGFYVWRKSTT
ncbi:hypothetical protein N9S47_01570 [Flavobacteriaceae bacterium]|nr:hypothetical protein [Flavobacteriaceae bacterium]